MADKALPWRRILLTAWTWSPVLTISADTRTVRGDLNVRSPCLLAILFLAIHSFLPETLIKKVTAEISGYRPISLISCIGKLYTLLWLRPLVEQVSPHIGPAQGAFRKGTSAVEQAWAITEMAHEQVGVGEADPHLMLTDLEKC